jgi:hypothetical protein
MLKCWNEHRTYSHGNISYIYVDIGANLNCITPQV